MLLVSLLVLFYLSRLVNINRVVASHFFSLSSACTAGADFERSRSELPGSSVACSPEKFYNLRSLKRHFLHFQATLG